MTDRELMQQALDLLDDINQCSLPPTGIPLPAEIDHVMEALCARLAQPKQEWQGLTDEEVGMLTVFDGLHHVETPLLADFTRAIEQALKEKNGFA